MSESRPNILVVMTDEHNPMMSSAYGHPFVETPALDRLAARGALFDAAYCNSPLCAPSRASFITGRYVHRIGVWDHGSILASEEPTWAHRLNRLGYQTAAIGRMHFNGDDHRHGFQVRSVADVEPIYKRGIVPANWDAPIGRNRIGLRHLDARPGDSTYQTYDDRVLAAARDHLRRMAASSTPWAAMVSFITPHYPFTVRKSYWDRYYPEHADLPDLGGEDLAAQHPQNLRFREFWGLADAPEEMMRRSRAAYYALVSFADERVGGLLDTIDELGLAESTVIAYTSDHGELAGAHGLWAKASYYEDSSRVPLILSWPGHFTEGVRLGRVTSLVDLTRTIVEAAGDDDAAGLDGKSLVPLLTGAEPDGGGEAFSEYEAQMTDRPSRMIRRGRYKLNYYWNEPVELFDLESDPGELHDLAGSEQHHDVVAELTTAVLDDWDPEAIDRRVRANQAMRRIVVAGEPPSTEDRWFLGRLEDD